MKLNRAIYLVLVAIMQVFFFLNCKKEATKIFPTVTTAPMTNITGYTATTGGEVVSDGGTVVTARGVCWSTIQNPTITDNKTSDGTGSGSFTSSLIGLIPGSTYYIRAYANNNVGTAYGNQVSMTVPNDYLPLNVGAKYKYNYSASTTFYFPPSSLITKGECTWTFINKSVDTPVIYNVEESFSGYHVHRYDNGMKDSAQIENQISTLSFEVANDGMVSVTLLGMNRRLFPRYIQSDKTDTCIWWLNMNSGCLRKNVGFTNLSYGSCGNSCFSISYSLIEGPY